MKRAVILASLVIFACSSVFLLCSCAKKQVVAEEKEITAPPKEEAAKVEEEEQTAVEVAKEVKEEEEKEFEKAEEARLNALLELEMAKKGHEDEREEFERAEKARIEKTDELEKARALEREDLKPTEPEIKYSYGSKVSTKEYLRSADVDRKGELTVSQITKKYSPSVVTIVALDKNDQPLSLGSGFFINTTGDTVTNHHVLEGSAKGIIKTFEGEKGEVIEILKDDPKLDLLVVETSLRNTLPVVLGDSDAIILGEKIVALGNPAGSKATVSNGIITGARTRGGLELIEITASISPGSSGGPVFNLFGEVIGVATAFLDSREGLNFALPVNYLKTLKLNRLELNSLPRMTIKLTDIEREGALMEIFDIHYDYDLNSQHLTGIKFAIRNLSNYPIRNIKVFFVYKNSLGEVVSYSAKTYKGPILPKLPLLFSNRHTIHYLRKWDSHYRDWTEGTVEIRILDYKIDRSVRKSPVDLILK